MNLILSIIYPIFAVGIDYSNVINTNMNKVTKKLALLIMTLVVVGSETYPRAETGTGIGPYPDRNGCDQG